MFSVLYTSLLHRHKKKHTYTFTQVLTGEKHPEKKNINRASEQLILFHLERLLMCLKTPDQVCPSCHSILILYLCNKKCGGQGGLKLQDFECKYRQTYLALVKKIYETSSYSSMSTIL